MNFSIFERKSTSISRKPKWTVEKWKRLASTKAGDYSKTWRERLHNKKISIYFKRYILFLNINEFSESNIISQQSRERDSDMLELAQESWLLNFQ